MKIAWRNLIRNRRFALQNLLGLVTAMTAFLLIMRYTAHEQGFDRHFPDAEHLYRVTTQFSSEDALAQYATSPPPLGPLLQTREGVFSDVCRAYTWSDFTLRTEAKFDHPYREQNVWIVDTSFFSVFGTPLLYGDPKTALSSPDKFVLTYSAAVKYFGKEAVQSGRVIGQSLLGGKDGGGVFQVGGILPDVPVQSHWQFDMLLANPPRGIADFPDWGWNILHTYVRLSPGVSPDQANTDLQQLVVDHVLKQAEDAGEEIPPSTSLIYTLQSVPDIHLHSHLQREMQPNGNADYVWLLFWVGIGILLLAVVNYINLATAQATQRFSTNGIRKLMGASRQQLIQEILLESLLMAGLAATLAFLLAEQLTPLFSQYFLGHKLPFLTHALQGIGYWLGMTTAIGLVAGLFPALYLSRINLRDALRKVQTGGGKQPFRQLLVTGQMVLSVSMMLASMIVFQQMRYLQTKRLGFDKEQVLVIQNDREIGHKSEREAFRTQMKALPQVASVSFSTGIPALSDFHMRTYQRPDQTDGQGIRWYQADEGFANALQLELVKGRWFDTAHPTDSAGVILNEAAFQALGLKDLSAPYIIKNKGANDETRQRVIGVIRDFHYASFQEAIQPLVIEHLHDAIFKDYISIRLQAGDMQAAMANIRQVWDKAEPGVPFTSFFLDTHFDRLYRSEKRLSQLFALFTFLAMIIASLGLIGLAAFSAARRQKELSIRTIVGAARKDLWWLMTKSYVRITAVAVLLGLPLAAALMQNWLNQFAYQTPLHIQHYLLPALFALILSLGVISWYVHRAVRRSPVEVLREGN